MNGQDIMFQRHTNVPDGIHDSVEFNEYIPDGTRWVTIGQLFGGTMMVFLLVVAYVFVAWLEG